MSEYKIKTINGRKIPEHRAVIEELLGITLDKNRSCTISPATRRTTGRKTWR